MVPNVVMGVTRDAFAVSTGPPARLVETVPVTVPREVTPKKKKKKERTKEYNAIVMSRLQPGKI